MRISKKKRPEKSMVPHYRMNTFIKAPEVRLLDISGEHIGLMRLSEALRIAQEQELDLVEINPKAEPPVAQIMDFKHFKYQKEKEARKQKARAHFGEIKGIRLSIRIGAHDLEIRKNQAEKFLERGDKVKIDVVLKGSENGKAHLGFEILKKFCDMVASVVEIKFEQTPQKQGNVVSATITKS